jgi:hypothetical protein
VARVEGEREEVERGKDAEVAFEREEGERRCEELVIEREVRWHFFASFLSIHALSLCRPACMQGCFYVEECGSSRVVDFRVFSLVFCTRELENVTADQIKKPRFAITDQSHLMQEAMSGLREQIAALEGEKSQAARELDEAKAKTADEVMALREEISGLRTTLEDALSRASATALQLAAAESSSVEARRDADSLRGEVDALKAERDEVVGLNSALRGELDAQKAKSDKAIQGEKAAKAEVIVRAAKDSAQNTGTQSLNTEPCTLVSGRGRPQGV